MLDFLLKILSIDSTTGKEELLADFLISNYQPLGAEIAIQELFNGKKNIFYRWGLPKIVFCTHLDTVPPFIPPRRGQEVIFGRGSCDAKGQIAVMFEACRQLHEEKHTDFGLLLVAGEEIGTYGAKQANAWVKGCEYVIIGEPTENKLIKAAKGTMRIDVEIRGKAAHSGYPERGESAIAKMQEFFVKLARLEFPHDEILGETTYNISSLSSKNPINVISDLVVFKIFFRTTFKSHEAIKRKLMGFASEDVALEFVHGDEPMKFFTVDGFATDVVSFGSDAPKLDKLGERLLYGPGSILTAHTEKEQIAILDLQRAITDLKLLYYKLS